MTKQQKRGCVLTIIGLLLVLAALGLHLAEEMRDQLAGKTAEVLLQHLELNQTPVDLPVPLPDSTPRPDTPMAEKEYLGYAMIGTIRVPSVGIELPVLSSWSYELLNVAPCRYYGSIPGKNLVIMGHNYKSHFTPLHEVSDGAEVIFEDVNGMKYRYRVAQIQQLHKNDGELLPSEHPLILFTCTPGGQNRRVIRCEMAEDQS